MSDLFERAAKQKIRFESSRGIISTEDIYDMSMTELDKMYKFYNKKLKESTEDSLMSNKSKESVQHKLKLNIIEKIFNEKQKDRDKLQKKKENQENLNLLVDALQEKKKEAIKGMSEKDLLKQIEELS